MRTSLFLLILLSFLFQGVQPVRASICPMHDASVVTDTMDCCNDPQTFAETGQTCKTDVVCVLVAVSLPSKAATSEMTPATDRVSSSVILSSPALQLASIWRPPALR